MRISGICKLCQTQANLDHSHIFSKALFKVLRGPTRTFLGIHGNGRYGFEVMQDGEKEHLFCRDCEEFCSKNYEKPFCDMWFEAKPRPIPERWPETGNIDIRVTYAPFKLFHLLNLFRASVSTLPSFRDVQLGPHEENFRTMLLNQQPGPSELYAVAASVIFNPATREPAKIVTVPQRYRDGSHTLYSQVYGGAMWMVVVSSGGAPATRRAAIKENGAFSMMGLPWQSLTVMNEASKLIAGKEKPNRK